MMLSSLSLGLPRVQALEQENLKLKRCLEVLRELDDEEISKLVQAQKQLLQHAAKLQVENQRLHGPCAACVELQAASAQQEQARSLVEARLRDQKDLWQKEQELRKRADHEINRLVQDRQKLREQLAKAQADTQPRGAACAGCVELRAAVTQLTAQVQEQRELLKSDEAVKLEAMKEIQALMTEVEQASAASTKSGSAVSGLEAQVASLTQQLAEARAKRQTLVSEAASSEGELRAKLLKLQADFAQVAAVRDHLLGVVDGGKQELQELQAQLRTALEERDKAQRINAKWNDKVQDLKEKKRKAGLGKGEAEPGAGPARAPAAPSQREQARTAKERLPAAAATAAAASKPSPAKSAQPAASLVASASGPPVAPAARDAQGASVRWLENTELLEGRAGIERRGASAGPEQGSFTDQGGQAPRPAAGPKPQASTDTAAASTPQAEEGAAAAEAAAAAGAGADVGLRFALQKHPAKKKASAKLSTKTMPTPTPPASSPPAEQQQQQQQQQQAVGVFPAMNPYLQPHFMHPHHLQPGHPALGVRPVHMMPQAHPHGHQLQPPEVMPGMPGTWLHPPPHGLLMNLQQTAAPGGWVMPPMGPGVQHPWPMPLPGQHAGVTEYPGLQQPLEKDWAEADQTYASGSSGRAAGSAAQGGGRRRGAQAGEAAYAGDGLDGQQRREKRARGGSRWDREEEEEWEEEWEPEARQDRGRGSRHQERYEEEGEEEEGELGGGSRGRGAAGSGRARTSDQRDRRGGSPRRSRSPTRDSYNGRRGSRRQYYSSDEEDRHRSSRRGYSRRSPDRGLLNYGDL